jgi:GNAT superfamily N-acetyltransferase
MKTLPEVSDTLPPAPGEPPRVRPARIRDWARLSRLAHQIFPELDEARLSHWLRNERHSLVVAITSRGLVGFVRLEVQPLRKVTVLDHLGVDAAARGQGVGSALLTYCSEVACACSAPHLEASVHADDPVLDAFCRHHGFKALRESRDELGQHCRQLSRRVTAPLWPVWDLRSLHAPRVPPAMLERLATRALYGAWLGRTLWPQPGAQAPSRGWALISPAASGSARA